MFEIGWTEILVIAIVLIVVVGPKDLPPMLRAFGRMTSKMRSMAGEFRSQFDEALREAELDDVKKTLTEARSLNPMNQIRDAMNPLKAAGDDIRANLEKSVKPDTVPSNPAPAEQPVAPKVEVPEPALKLAGGPPTLARPAPEPAAKPAPAAKAKAGSTAKAAEKPLAKSAAAKPTEAAPAKASAKKSTTAMKAPAKAATPAKPTAAKAPAKPRKPAKDQA